MMAIVYFQVALTLLVLVAVASAGTTLRRARRDDYEVDDDRFDDSAKITKYTVRPQKITPRK